MPQETSSIGAKAKSTLDDRSLGVGTLFLTARSRHSQGALGGRKVDKRVEGVHLSGINRLCLQ
jgi:hypothetical protein